MYRIAKQFDFCYGHRVWSQSLNPTFSLDSCLKCRHVHGHQGTINIFLEAEKLSEGMVTDFKHLNWFKKWLDDTLDHKFIMDISDPVRDSLFPLSLIPLNFERESRTWTLYSKDLENQPEPVKEVYEGLVFVDFVPTSENLSKWIFDIVEAKMLPLGVRVSGVQFYETPKSQSNYINPFSL